MTILKSNSGKMLEYLTIELQSGWDVNDLADALLVDKWTVEEIEKLSYKEITKAVKESIVYNGRAKIEDAYQDVYNYKNNGRPQPIWWDGFSQGRMTIKEGEKVPVGTYYYIIYFDEDNRSPQTGWVYVNY